MRGIKKVEEKRKGREMREIMIEKAKIGKIKFMSLLILLIILISVTIADAQEMNQCEELKMMIYWSMAMFGIVITLTIGYSISRGIQIDRELELAQQARKDAEEARKESEIKIKNYREEALKAAKKAEAYVHFVNARILLKFEENREAALKSYDIAIDLYPEFTEAYYNRGNLKDDKGDYDGAITDYTKAIELKPDFAAAYHNRGVAKSKKGENAEKNEEKRKWYEEAIADFKEAIRLNPNDESAKKILESVEKLIKNL